ncbi:pyridine nucleotide-disulfide oxidoreductase [Prevotella lacticifex]|uniref:dihydrolipoyl dehydrogenase family protein n=1 Tax=Prevotella lacticifex TaxID=2854755 RepID=UPI001CC39231|nr:NAD(P)/FAD-dependent oxidoreductase [Prevotella lacticifex]GJG66800.1 pyridine nucleotide-disulfide oxidoreductase [Prevotella lacticifex]
MSNYDFYAIFVGCGHGCDLAARVLAKAGKRVAAIERDLWMGTCTNYGCNAKILLDGPFELTTAMENYLSLGIFDKVPQVNWEKLMQYKIPYIEAYKPVTKALMEESGCTCIHGHGKLKDAHTVVVDGKEYTAEYIVLGPGQRDNKLDIPGKEYIHGSRDMLSIEQMPKRIVFIGAGIISMEFASMAVDMGREVTIIDHGDHALKAYPREYVDEVVALMEKKGARFKYCEDVCAIEKTATGLMVKAKSGFEVEADYVLEATGRPVNYENLGLEALGIEAGPRGIKVDDHLRTAVKNIFATGDAIDKRIPKLTPTALFESQYIADLLLGKTDKPICYPAVPNLVFTFPRIAQVGVGLDEARKNNKYRVADVPYGQFFLFNTHNEATAKLAFIFDKESNLLVGAAAVGSDAGAWIDVLSLVIFNKMTREQFAHYIYAFPTTTCGPLMLLSQMW